MKKYRAEQILSLLLAVILLFSLVSCKNLVSDKEKIEETTAEKAEKTDTGKKDYTKAINVLAESENLHMKLSVYTDRQVGVEKYSFDTTKKIDLTFEDEKIIGAAVSSMVKTDTTWYYLEEYFANDTVMLKIQPPDFAESVRYSSAMSAEEYIYRCIPAKMLDPKLYENIYYSEDKENTVIFDGAKGLEEWVAPGYAEMISADGSAKLSKDGNIDSITYNVSYRQGSAVYTSNYSMIPSETPVSEADFNDEDAEYITIDNIDFPVYLINSEIAINSALSLMGNWSEEITVGLAAVPAISVSINEIYDLYKDNAKFAAEMDCSVRIADANGQQSSNTTFTYKDGTSYTKTDNAEPETNDLTPALYTSSIKNSVKSFFPTVDIVTNITSVDTGEFILFEYDFKEDTGMGTEQENHISSLIYNDPNYLDDRSSSYKTAYLKGYLAIDKDAQVPTSMGFGYMGTHNIENDLVTLSNNMFCSLDIGSTESYKNVTGEYLFEEKPERKATPLFYEVTSPEGAKMYLLGTIHLGDERTAYLPDEIYTALENSDALALEIDTETFTDKVLADPALLSELQNSYYYLDGTTIEDHLPEELYSSALTAMKISGMYNLNAMVMRPSLWGTTLSQFLMSSSKQLYFHKGVDNRLYSIASTRGLEIRDIENLSDRVKMEGRYSEKLHEMLLEDALAYPRYEAVKDALELYELWCEGDEKKLTEYIRDEGEISEDATEQEIQAAEDYDLIMSIERDEQMVKRAKEYLSNKDETVFFAVGLSHLLSETGLVDQLREAGYTVSLIEYN